MLDHFIAFLAYNTKLDWQAARKGAQTVASIG